MTVCQAVASWPSEQPTVSIFIRDSRLPVRRHDPAGRQPAAGPDPDQPDVHGEVVVDRLPLDRFDEVHLRRPLAVQLAVEQVDHDLARESVRAPLAAAVELEDVGTGQDQAILRACCE